MALCRQTVQFVEVAQSPPSIGDVLSARILSDDFPLQIIKNGTVNSNQITSFERRFTFGKNLQRLIFFELFDSSTGPVNFIEVFHPAIVDAFPNLERIILASCGMRRIGKNSFRNCQNIRTVNFMSNSIEEIPAGVFSNCGNLESINFRWNRITNIQPGAFEGLNRVDSIILEVNQISILSPSIFVNLNQLSSLEFGWNSIRRLNSNTFGVLPNLGNFDINTNSLSEIEPNFFDNFPALDSFDTRFNLCANIWLNDTSSIDFTQNPVLAQCFANW